MKTNHVQDTIKMLFWVGVLLMAYALFASVRFQLSFAHTQDEQIAGVLLGVGIPLATVCFLNLSVLLRQKIFIVFAFMLFVLLFHWEWHGQLSISLNGNQANDDNSIVSKLQSERLKLLDSQLDNLPVSNAHFSESIDDKIETTRAALSKCQKGHASLCINPNTERLNALIAAKEQQGIQAQIKQQRNDILSEKSNVLNALSGMDSRVENAKVMPVYKGISWAINKLGGNISPKEAQYLASIIGTFIYTIIPAVVWGFRTKLIMENQTALPYSEQTANTPNAAGFFHKPVWNFSPEALREKYSPSFNAVFQRKSSAEPVPVFERGHSESLIVDTPENTQPPKNTTGFYKFIDTDTSELIRPSVSNPIQNTEPDTLENTRDSSALGLDAMKTAIENGNFFQTAKSVSGRAVMSYLRSIGIKCAQSTAYQIVDTLKIQGVIDDTGAKK